ncbi:MAG: CpsD/CapB family tyrosine-protein kinase [Terracidiphilus sp.]|jgi:capsular exopolysaccharide synthesis family protein
MSRIFDALQRAELERRSAHEADGTETAESFAVFDGEEMPAVQTDLLLEKVAMHSWNPSLAALPTLDDRGAGIEQFRGLRSQLYKFRDQAPMKTILVSSGIPAEGKTFVVANLAMSLARNKDNSILLIDADLRRPALHTILGAPNWPGLTEYLDGSAEAQEILQRNFDSGNDEAGQAPSIPNLTFIPAGTGGDNSLELIANHRFEELITILSPHFDWILIDSPPALAFADAIDLARAADAVLLVARGAATPFDVAQRAQTAFSNTRLLGFVLNAVKYAPRNTAYYYYGEREPVGGPRWRKDKRR